MNFILATNKDFDSLKGNINPISLICSFIVNFIYINSFFKYYNLKLTVNY